MWNLKNDTNELTKQKQDSDIATKGKGKVNDKLGVGMNR